MTYYSHVAVVLNMLPSDLKKEEKKKEKLKTNKRKKNQYEQEHRIIH